MTVVAELDRAQPAQSHRWRAAIVGGRPGPDGKPTAIRAYSLACAPDPESNGLLVTMVEDMPDIGITFEATDFDHAFARALAIGEGMAEAAGHLADGVLISLVERESLAELGIE